MIFILLILTKLTTGFIFYNNSIICSNSTEKLVNNQAVNILRINSIAISSFGDCMSRNNSYCTSLDQINCASIRGLITYKLNSKCPIIITGGTEVGFENEEFSHYNGYRLNIDLNLCHDTFIKKNYKFIGKLKNGSPEWQDNNFNIYRLEGNHYNIYFYQI